MRTFAAPVTLAIQVKDSTGQIVHSQTTNLGPNFFQQYAASVFLNGFEVGAILWDKKVSPVIGQRLSYDVGHGAACLHEAGPAA